MTQTLLQLDHRASRRKQTGEVFTPNNLVNKMLAKLPREVWRKNKTFCDPACGNGQFLIWVLIRKIKRGHKPLEALKTVFGADIMGDNIRECRLRLLKVISVFEEIKTEHIETVFQNIVWINKNKFPLGSLQYDFSFKNKPKKEDIERWMNFIHKKNGLNEVDLPIKDEKFLPPGTVDMFFNLED